LQNAHKNQWGGSIQWDFRQRSFNDLRPVLAQIRRFENLSPPRHATGTNWTATAIGAPRSRWGIERGALVSYSKSLVVNNNSL
jgi:hypothetical protein